MNVNPEQEMAEELRYILAQIHQLIDELPPCTCHNAYLGRGLIDPSCAKHNAIDDTLYLALVDWRNKMSNPPFDWMVK